MPDITTRPGNDPREELRERVARKHQDHYRFCNCLGDSSECCVSSCECHAASPSGPQEGPADG